MITDERQLREWAVRETLHKVEGEERTALGVVLRPGDDGSTEAIRNTAHAFLAGQRKLRAAGVLPKSICPVESYLAPAELRLGEATVPVGSWVLVVRVKDDALWQRVKQGGVGFAVSTSKVQWGVKMPLRLKAEQKSAIELQLGQLLRVAVGVMNQVRDAEVDERALPSSELTGVFRNLADGFGKLAGSGQVTKAGRKISMRRAEQFRKALRILLALAAEFGLEQKGIFKALRGAGFELPDEVETEVADPWPADLNATADATEDRENG